MAILTILILLAIIGAAWWATRKYTPVPPVAANVIGFILALIVVLHSTGVGIH